MTLKTVACASLLGSFSLAATVALAHGDSNITTPAGRSLEISYFVATEGSLNPADDLNVDVNAAVICGNDVKELRNVQLWMPHHGHGSAPTRLTRDGQPSECVLVEDIAFIMPGHWELQVEFADGDRAAFEAHVHP